MARSHDRTPIVSMTITASEKQDKRQANRNCRSALRRALKGNGDPDAAVLPILRTRVIPGTWRRTGRRGSVLGCRS